MRIATPSQSTHTVPINDHAHINQNDGVSCYQSFVNTISNLCSTLSQITCCANRLNQPRTAAPIMTQTPFLKLSSALQTEVIQSANERVLHRYGEKTIQAAKKWRTDDFASVDAILQCLPKEVVLPDDPSQIYLFRNQKKTSKNIDLEKCLVRNNPASEALINDDHLLDVHRTRDLIAMLEARENHVPLPLVLSATKKVAGISHAESHQITKVVVQTENPSGISGIHGILPHGGINFLVSTQPNIENRYGQNNPNLIHLRVNLKSILDVGGKIYKDIGAAVWHAVIVELPSKIDGLSYLDMSNITPNRTAILNE